MKLQAVIDAAFGVSDTPPAAQGPTDQVVERERAFSDRAKKIELLRRERLAPPAAGPGLAPLLFEVVRYRGHWRTLHRNKRSSAYADQGVAILAAKKLAVEKRSVGHEVKVILQRTDGNAVILSIDE